MKTRLLTLTLAVVLFAFGMYVYKYPPVSIPDDQICMRYSNLEMNTLSSGLVHEIVNEYRDRQLRYIETSEPLIKDAESIWFDLETIKKFIYHLEFNTKKLENTITTEDLGLRIYYASYPEVISPTDPELGDLAGKGYEKHHTLVIIPTKRINGEEVDFNPLDINTYQLGLGAINDYDYTNPKDAVGVDPSQAYIYRNPLQTAAIGGTNNDSGDPRPGAQNHGGLYPPRVSSGLGF